jgi:hypothetical protein
LGGRSRPLADNRAFGGFDNLVVLQRGNAGIPKWPIPPDTYADPEVVRKYLEEEARRGDCDLSLTAPPAGLGLRTGAGVGVALLPGVLAVAIGQIPGHDAALPSAE